MATPPGYTTSNTLTGRTFAKYSRHSQRSACFEKYLPAPSDVAQFRVSACGGVAPSGYTRIIQILNARHSVFEFWLSPAGPQIWRLSYAERTTAVDKNRGIGNRGSRSCFPLCRLPVPGHYLRVPFLVGAANPTGRAVQVLLVHPSGGLRHQFQAAILKR